MKGLFLRLYCHWVTWRRLIFIQLLSGSSALYPSLGFDFLGVSLAFRDASLALPRWLVSNPLVFSQNRFKTLGSTISLAFTYTLFPSLILFLINNLGVIFLRKLLNLTVTAYDVLKG